MNNTFEGLDEIDRHILRILAQDPRIPYSDISDRLEEEGYEMSGEGIRYRVSKLYESSSVLLLTAPREHGWEVLRIDVTVSDEADAKSKVMERLAEEKFWLVSRGLGTFDIYAVATVRSNREADDLVSTVKEIDAIDSVTHTLETDRITDLDNYLAFEDED